MFLPPSSHFVIALKRVSVSRVEEKDFAPLTQGPKANLETGKPETTKLETFSLYASGQTKDTVPGTVGLKGGKLP
jgi:hypothetical protein